MRIRFSLLIVILMLLPMLQAQAHSSASSVGPVSPGSATVNPDSIEIPTDRVIIRYKASADLNGSHAPASADRMSALSAVAGVQLEYFREMSGGAHVLRLPGKLPLSEVRQVAARLMKLGDVEHAQPDYIWQPTFSPNDTRYGEQWHYYEATGGINLPAAWDITTGSSNIVVAVIDTGILNHADLAGRTVAGYDFISDAVVANDGGGRDSDPSDPGDWVAANACYTGSPARNSSWHGTHVAGTIGAASNNNQGVAGINWVSKILPVRGLGRCGGYTSDIADGMRWAAGLSVSGVPNNSNPAKVINMSLGGYRTSPPYCDTEEQTAINDAIAAGTSVIVAAGNSNDDASHYSPSSCNGVVTVAATNRSGYRASYSNYGSVVEISAPGGDGGTGNPNAVLSTLNTGTQGPVADTYAFYQGTSMSTPHVVGVASLLLSINPSLTPSQVLQILQSTARPFPSGSTCNTSICGVGIVDAGAAVRSIVHDVSIWKQVFGSDLEPGDRVTFTLSISNTSGTIATSVVVTDIIPSQVLTPTYASTIPITRTGVYSYVWNVGTLGIGQGGLITIYGQIDPSLPSNFGFANNASISAAQDYAAGNNSGSVLVGGLKVFLPVVLKNFSSAAGGWVTIVSEDFEGGFPGAWQVSDNDGTTQGEYYWAKRTCRPYAGSYSGWAVGGGADGGGLSCGSNYPNYADSWMVYGPFSLVGATAGDLSFKLWLNSESGFDGVCRMASTDGSYFVGTCTSGNTAGWSDRVLDLTNVGSLGNLMGQPNVWVAIQFESDFSNNYAEGGYVDNIVLRKYVSSTALSSNASPPDTSGGQIVEMPAFKILRK